MTFTKHWRLRERHETVEWCDHFQGMKGGPRPDATWWPVAFTMIGTCVDDWLFNFVTPQNPEPDDTLVKEPDKLALLEAERGKVYGEPRASHANIGLAWTALINQHFGITLDHPIPDHVVAKMMVAFKNQRAVRVFHQDNFDDARVYLNFSERFQKGEP